MATKRVKLKIPGYVDMIRTTYDAEDFRLDLAVVKRETQIQQRTGA